jgi:hypothetical protein
MDKKLIEKYRQYAASSEAFAVLFVKEHLKRADGHWVDIRDWKKLDSGFIKKPIMIGGLARFARKSLH